MFQSIVQYIKDSANELAHKVTWPTKEELQKQTSIVFTATIIVALLLLGVDSIFNQFIKSVLNILQQVA